MCSFMDATVLNAINSIQTEPFLFSRCVKTEWRAVDMAFSLDLLVAKAYWWGSNAARDVFLSCAGKNGYSKHFIRGGGRRLFRYHDDGCREAAGNSLSWGHVKSRRICFLTYESCISTCFHIVFFFFCFFSHMWIKMTHTRKQPIC